MLKKYCFLVLLFYSCARQVAPTGGPDDKTPPTVRYTTPLIATVRYPVKSAITFHFSEWVDKKTAEKCISVFPVPPKGFTIKISGKSIEVRPVQAFAESTTYHIEVGTSLMDLHGNSIGTPFHFFFSTGPTIDSGKVFGCVISADGAPIQTKIALFTRLSPVFADTAFFNFPNYLVQADSSGLFTFDHIRKGAYAIVAFIDANNDNRIQPGIEQAFAPVDKCITVDSIVGPIVLYPVASDTVTNRIVSISPISNLVVMGTWARIPDSAASIAREQWKIQRADTPAMQCRIKACVSLPNSSKFLLTLTDTLRSAAYRLWYKVPVRLIRGSALASDSIRFTGIRVADTACPVATGFFPQGAAELKPHIKLVWSKPVTPARPSWFMADSSGDSVKLTMDTTPADTTRFSLSRSLKPGTLYRIRFTDTLFSDLSGNHPRDSLFGKYSVQTISADNLCYSLSGEVPCLNQNEQRTWIFKPLNAADTYVVKDRGGRFRFDSIPSCKGRIGYVIDFSGDNRPTQGSLVPWVKPEPYRLFPDTVEARARWDIEGVTVKACEICEKKIAPSNAPASALQPVTKKNNPLQSIK